MGANVQENSDIWSSIFRYIKSRNKSFLSLRKETPKGKEEEGEEE